ncbi:germination-specific N-acetylmuramoyl-L-alanine amidase precursor [Clostridium coskatii]|uniref:Germination-specific N-acetylmuramoyl-L-alanine amidase n=2 Tax=Clostridium coskatii TaxID=1705578 RepID=A0A166UEG3_9CLOT|nr:Germination-specific N-acetylmuramoyl-L-alanine amidase precursor [Clostridium coskatii]OBR93796.1 germination-specific N-acetylmuramoyl-L-alanine amidase precursor [Clostridium coskatii]
MNIKKARVILLILAICSINMVCPFLVLGNENVTKESSTILIDPGHGGIDSGAISKDGIMEKEINLKISNKLKDKLLKEKFKVVMTREKDEGLYTDDGRIRKKKVEDLNNRCELKKSTKCNMFISIHLNMFPQTKYYGAQVWYSKNDNSKKLAYILQKNLVNDLDKNNNRKEKAAKNSYKVLRCEDTRPSVLIECGFLSNAQEKNKLVTDEYQNKIADSIARSVKEYYSSN